MKAYILSVICVSIVAAIVILLTPDGNGGGIAKHVKLLTSLSLLAVIINPFLNFVKSLSDTSFNGLKENILENVDNSINYENILYESLSDISKETLETEIKKLISKKFEIAGEDLVVNSEYVINEGTVTFTRITVILSGGAIFKSPYDIEEYVKEISGINCKCLL